MGRDETRKIGEGAPILVEANERLSCLLIELTLQSLIENTAERPRLHPIHDQPEDKSSHQTKGERQRRDRNTREKPAIERTLTN